MFAIGEAPVHRISADASTAEQHADTLEIRQLRTADLDACRSFFDRLGPDDVRARFASPTFAIDYFLPSHVSHADEAAFAAFADVGPILGVVNLSFLSAASAEIAIIVRSDQQRSGIGRALVTHAMRWAEGHGRLEVIGLISMTNRSALLFARALGFGTIRWDRYRREVMRLVS